MLGAALRRHHEVILAVAFVAMASYELLEIRALEPSRASRLSLALHTSQVLVILAATYAVLRAWRRKTAHGEAMARLMEQVVLAQEDERRRVAYDLHDGVAQFVVSAKQHLDTAVDLVRPDATPAARELATASQRLEQAIGETRRVLLALRPPAIDDGGLVAAARRSLEQAAEEAGWRASFMENLGGIRLPPAVETAGFRILQEALTNARKHAGAARIDVELRREDDRLVIDVLDSGGGSPIGESALRGHGLGLDSMRERAWLLGGTCTITREPLGGTRVHAVLPIHHAARDHGR